MRERVSAGAVVLALRDARGHVVGMNPTEAARRTEAAIRALHLITTEERDLLLRRAEALRFVARACREEAEAIGGTHGQVRAREAELYDREADILGSEASTIEQEAATERTKADSALQRALAVG